MDSSAVSAGPYDGTVEYLFVEIVDVVGEQVESSSVVAGTFLWRL